MTFFIFDRCTDVVMHPWSSSVILGTIEFMI